MDGKQPLGVAEGKGDSFALGHCENQKTEELAIQSEHGAKPRRLVAMPSKNTAANCTMHKAVDSSVSWLFLCQCIPVPATEPSLARPDYPGDNPSRLFHSLVSSQAHRVLLTGPVATRGERGKQQRSAQRLCKPLEGQDTTERTASH